MDNSEIQKQLEDVWKNRVSESNRRFVMRRYCKTYGNIMEDSSEPNFVLCDDSTCSSCNIFREALDEAIKDFKIDE